MARKGATGKREAGKYYVLGEVKAAGGEGFLLLQGCAVGEKRGQSEAPPTFPEGKTQG